MIVSAKHGHNKYWKRRRSLEVESYRTSPANLVLILAERDCQAQPLGVSEITLRSYGKIILGKLFKTNEDSGGREPNIVASFRSGRSGGENGDDTKNY